MVIWYGLKPILGHFFRCSDKLFSIEGSEAVDLFRETPACSLLREALVVLFDS
jgi:hypothetical protein